MTFSPAPKPSPRVSLSDKARKPVNRVNAKRKKSEWLRAYGSKERVEFVKSRPCPAFTTQCFDQPIENAHIESGGKSRKADTEKIVGLCALHHRMLHEMGRASFEDLYSLNLEELAAETERCWQAFQELIKENENG